jgi:hypothetical protein
MFENAAVSAKLPVSQEGPIFMSQLRVIGRSVSRWVNGSMGRWVDGSVV